MGDAENAFELRTFGRDRDSARFYDIADLSNSDAESSHGDEPIVAFRYGKEKSSFTPDQAEAVVRKLDRRLVLFLAVLYMLSFLDRSSMYRRQRLLFHNLETDKFYRYRKRENSRPYK